MKFGNGKSQNLKMMCVGGGGAPWGVPVGCFPLDGPKGSQWATFGFLPFLSEGPGGSQWVILGPECTPPTIEQNAPKYERNSNEQHTFSYRIEERSEQGTLGGLIFEPPLPRRFKDQTSSSLRARNELNPKYIFLYIKVLGKTTRWDYIR